MSVTKWEKLTGYREAIFAKLMIVTEMLGKGLLRGPRVPGEPSWKVGQYLDRSGYDSRRDEVAIPWSPDPDSAGAGFATFKVGMEASEAAAKLAELHWGIEDVEEWFGSLGALAPALPPEESEGRIDPTDRGIFTHEVEPTDQDVVEARAVVAAARARLVEISMRLIKGLDHGRMIEFFVREFAEKLPYAAKNSGSRGYSVVRLEGLTPRVAIEGAEPMTRELIRRASFVAPARALVFSFEYDEDRTNEQEQEYIDNLAITLLSAPTDSNEARRLAEAHADAAERLGIDVDSHLGEAEILRQVGAVEEKDEG